MWPWRFAQVAVDGIEELIVTKYGKNREEPKVTFAVSEPANPSTSLRPLYSNHAQESLSYPTTGTSTDPGDTEAGNEAEDKI